ncbi:MAG: DUF6089 family protein [Chitinophagaceae bacterium]
MNNNTIAAVIVFSLYHFTAGAQLNVPKYEIGAGIGAYVYQGDLTPSFSGSFRTMRVGINIHGSKIMSRSFMVRANLAFAGLRGDDAGYDDPEYRKQRAFNFRSPLFEVTGQLVWNPLGKNYDDKGFSPYLFGGAGFSFLKVKRDYSNFNAAYFGESSDIGARLAVDETQRLPRVQPVVPVGIGVRYNLSSRIAVNAESSYRFVFTDYLDGFSQSVNPQKDDHYHSTSVGIIYRIGKKNLLDCPVIRY